ncbi:MAG: type II secretion system F family protein [Planctomycetota bacterium]
MPKFKYLAKSNSSGNVSGTIIAENQAEAIRELRRKNLVILDVKKVESSGAIPFSNLMKQQKSRKRRKKDELVVFTRQLATMIGSGVPLLESLEILTEQIEGSRLHTAVMTLVEDIRAGSDMSKALEKHPKVFPNIYVNMVRAGEVSGQLDDILVRLAEYLEASARLRREVRAAMTYPAVSLLLVTAITAFLIVVIVPKFRPMFDSLEIDLPAITKFVLDVSLFCQEKWGVVAMGLVGGFIGLTLYGRTQRGSYQLDWCKLKAPVFGALVTKVALSRFARTFATLIRSGVPILGALDVVGETVGNRVIHRVIDKAKQSVLSGDTLSDPLSQSWVFPPMVTRMIAIGEKSGSMENLLEKISNFYDEQVSAMIKSLTSLIEPIMIAIMGGLVFFIVLAVFLPILELQKMLSNGG